MFDDESKMFSIIVMMGNNTAKHVEYRVQRVHNTNVQQKGFSEHGNPAFAVHTDPWFYIEIELE